MYESRNWNEAAKTGGTWREHACKSVQNACTQSAYKKAPAPPGSGCAQNLIQHGLRDLGRTEGRALARPAAHLRQHRRRRRLQRRDDRRTVPMSFMRRQTGRCRNVEIFRRCSNLPLSTRPLRTCFRLPLNAHGFFGGCGALLLVMLAARALPPFAPPRLPRAFSLKQELAGIERTRWRGSGVGG